MGRIRDRTIGCLFCGNTEGRFDSEEHVIGQALGNSIKSGLVESELVIPPGEHCDKCNRRWLSLRDAALAAWPPISIFRSLMQIRNRRGRLVDAVNGTQWEIAFHPDDRRLFRLFAQAKTGPDSGRDDVARALCKIALQMRWFEDAQDARSRRWDAIAAAALGGPLPETLAMGLTQPRDWSDIDPRPEAQVLVDDGSDQLRIVCQVWVVGLRLLLVIGSPPPTVPDTAWWTLSEGSNSLQGPGSMWADFRGRAQAATRLDSSEVDGSGDGLQLPTGKDGVTVRLSPSS